MPRQFVYIIDAYKFETIVIGILSVIAICLPLSSYAKNVHAADSSYSFIGSPYETYPKSNNAAAVLHAAAANSSGTTWPMQGRVTTEFGVPHYPWQRTHTGIDITSAQGSGIANVAAYRGGTVIATVWSYSGYGNHVIIDHGNGLTSLYGHLAAIAVSKGQVVQAGTVIGKEGSSGASTGTHLHFELRNNGQPINPRGHVPGSP